MIGEGNGVFPGGQGNGDHGPADQSHGSRGAVHADLPVAVLGNGGVEKTISVAGDAARQLRGREGGGVIGGSGENIVSLPEHGLVQHGGQHGNGAVLSGGAVQPNFYIVALLDLAHAEHQGQGITLGVNLCAVDADPVAVPGGQVQIDAEQPIPVRGVGVDHRAVAAGAGVGTAAQGGLGGNDRTALGGHVQRFAAQHVPGVAHPGGGGQQPVLEGEVVHIAVPVQVGKLAVDQKAQGQIGVVFQQVHVAIMMDLREVIIFLHG